MRCSSTPFAGPQCDVLGQALYAINCCRRQSAALSHAELRAGSGAAVHGQQPRHACIWASTHTCWGTSAGASGAGSARRRGRVSIAAYAESAVRHSLRQRPCVAVPADGLALVHATHKLRQTPLALTSAHSSLHVLAQTKIAKTELTQQQGLVGLHQLCLTQHRTHSWLLPHGNLELGHSACLLSR